ncbi:MAG: sel1 repeat family protein [Lentisphaeria bacterium]|nr:sel1 repeat family protein [Lentisphaeria bacterium]
MKSYKTNFSAKKCFSAIAIAALITGCSTTDDIAPVPEKASKDAVITFRQANVYLTEDNDEQAFKLYLKAAKAGHVPAMYKLGFCYSAGVGTELDPETGIIWIRRAAVKGYADAEFFMGHSIMVNPHSQEADITDSANWLRKAAIQGHAGANANLGLLYLKGVGVPKNTNLALKHLGQAARKGNTLAMFNLGHMYRAGYGVTKDHQHALEYYEQGAEAGDIPCMIYTGNMYLRGLGAIQDYDEAKMWFDKAAEKESAEAYFLLGTMYKNGTGVPVDIKLSDEYFAKAESKGYKRKDGAMPVPLKEGTNQ